MIAGSFGIIQSISCKPITAFCHTNEPFFCLLQASVSTSFYSLAPGLDVTLFGTLPDVASAAKVSACILRLCH